jgi:MarR family transcriptional regulator, organic hydroperoxide resistance regulator
MQQHGSRSMALREQVLRFTRSFGLLEQHRTPCGYPLSVSQVQALELLERRSFSLSELASELRLERSTVSRLVDALVKEGMVQRVINEQNRREVILTLAENGLRVVQEVRTQAGTYYGMLLEGATESEIERMLDGLTLLGRQIARNQRPKGESEPC